VDCEGMTMDPTEAQTLYADREGALPKPWVAFKKPDPPDKGSLYYHNMVTRETFWERPVMKVPPSRVLGGSGRAQQRFANWIDLPGQEHIAATAAEATESFRDFCLRLSTHGSFSRRIDGLLWGLGADEPIGAVLYPAQRHLAVCYDQTKVSRDDVAAMNNAACSNPLSMAAKLVAMRFICYSAASRKTAAETLVAPTAYILRRYMAELAGQGGGTLSRASPSPPLHPRPEVLPLSRYLENFQLLWPVTCSLSGAGSFKDEVEWAVHLTSDQHRQRRSHLRSACELLAEVRTGEVPLTEWLPEHLGSYRGLLKWCDHRFQEVPVSDGRVLRFDHLTGRGTMTPASTWMAFGSAPPPLVDIGTGDGGRAHTRDSGEGQIWVVASSSSTASTCLAGSVDDLLSAVNDSLCADVDARGHCDAQADGDHEWVQVGASWASSAHVETPPELLQRFMRIAPRPRHRPPS